VKTRYLVILLASATLFAPLGAARDKKPKEDPKDTIEVVAHIPLTDGSVTRFISTPHYSSFYLYAEREGGKITLLDVTKTTKPAVLGDVANPTGASGSLSVVAGTAALISSESAAPTAARAPQTIRIMDFSDPQNPKVAREFAGVTAMSRDDSRGLIFVANAEGIWILQQHLALDPEVEKAYDRYVLYNR
jgi:hypothetical protein